MSDSVQRMKSWLHSTGLDRAIAYSMLLKSWQAIAGLIGLVLIAGNFSREMQGFYYTFGSLVALQSFVELGFNLVISNFASHEWSKLRLGRDGQIEGDPVALSRLVSLGRFVFRWYGAGALIFLVLAGGGGLWFLGRAPASNVDWRMPWLAHIAFSSVIFWCMPFFSLLEGCDQVAQVARFRTYQAIASNIAIWVAILTGMGLWTAAAFSMIAASFCLYYLLVYRRQFFRPFLEPPRSKRMRWRTEILPMQWRLALQGIMSYFVHSLFTPVMFYYHGPTIAGQMGMTWQVVLAIQSIATIWVLTKAPRFGILVAGRDFAVLDSKWRKASSASLLIMLCGMIAAFLSVSLLARIHWEPVNRLLPPLHFLIMAGGSVFSLGVTCIAIYLRAHKREALTPVAMVTGLLMGITVWQFGATYGALGAVTSYLTVVSTVTFPMALLIWRRARRDWHR